MLLENIWHSCEAKVKNSPDITTNDSLLQQLTAQEHYCADKYSVFYRNDRQFSNREFTNLTSDGLSEQFLPMKLEFPTYETRVSYL